MIGFLSEELPCSRLDGASMVAYGEAERFTNVLLRM